MRICVLIVSYRRPQLLKNCLAALRKQIRLPDEAIVVGVTGDEATRVAVEESATAGVFPCVWRSAPAPSVVLQTNLGLATCVADIVVFTNDDAEPFEDWLSRIEARFSDETVGAVGGRDYVHLGNGGIIDGQVSQVGHITWFGRVHGNHHLSYPRAVDVDVLKGVNMSCRRALLSHLDTRLAGGGRWHWEIDASFKIRKANKRLVFDPAICVNHFPGPRPGTLDPEFVYMANFNLVFILAKHLNSWRRAAFLGYTFLWGDFPEMGVAVFAKAYLERLIRHRDASFVRLLGVSLRGKLDALRTLGTPQEPAEAEAGRP